MSGPHALEDVIETLNALATYGPDELYGVVIALEDYRTATSIAYENAPVPPAEFPDAPERFAGLVPGRLYRVEFDDCCAEGQFTARFLGLIVEPDTDGPFLAGLAFDTARIGPAWGKFTTHEIEEP